VSLKVNHQPVDVNSILSITQGHQTGDSCYSLRLGVYVEYEKLTTGLLGKKKKSVTEFVSLPNDYSKIYELISHLGREIRFFQLDKGRLVNLSTVKSFSERSQRGSEIGAITYGIEIEHQASSDGKSIKRFYGYSNNMETRNIALQALRKATANLAISS
jgi:hypothetical protein